MEPNQPPAISLGRLWSVSDAHSWNHGGATAEEAIRSSTYGLNITRSDKEGANCPIRLADGSAAIVSKIRWTRAKDIAPGDTLFLGDDHRGRVFKGRVTALLDGGAFRSQPGKNSFGERVRELAELRKPGCMKKMTPFENEIELHWSVEWTEIGKLTDEWKTYLRFSERSTVRALAQSPNFLR